MMHTMLSDATDEQVATTAFEVHQGHEPSDLSEFDGYLLTGSRKGVYDDEPWISRLLELIRKLHRAKIKTVGICFGHQAIAQALGGHVQKFADGWGVGVHAYDVLNPMNDRQKFINDAKMALPCCHQDQVVELPPDAQRILTSDFCANAGFVIDEHILALQPHPEFSVEYLGCILRMIEDRVGARTDEAIASLSSATDNALMAMYIVRFFSGFEASARFAA